VNRDVARCLELAQVWRSVGHAQAYQMLHSEASVQVKRAGSSFAIFEKPGSPLNRCTGLGFDESVSEHDVEQVEQFYHQQQAPSRISLCPLADPALLEILQKRSYQLEQFYSVLVRTLPDANAPIELPSSISIQRAETETADLWLETVAHGFSAPEAPDVDTYEILAPNFYAVNAIPYLAYVEGQPAGGAGMYLHEGVAEFGGASTLPAFRRRGVQTALLEVRMQAARQAGCDLGMVITSPGSNSQRNVERLGFQVAYTKTVMVKNE
jgi:GNAT superfamily N-acetyltransferase